MRSPFALERRLAALVGILAGTVIGVGCHRAAPDLPPTAPGAPATIQVLKNGRWLFTYADPSGTFSTTDKPETIPAASRGLVRVIEPDHAMKSGADRVYVTNVAQLLGKGKSSAKAMSREAFETAALAALPGGQSSPFAAQQMAPPPAGATPAPAGGTFPPGTTPVVTIYGTSWCGACRAARAYLTAHKIPFADKDIEHDPAAARELEEKAAKMGIPTDRIPIIDVRGRLLLGFDPARVQALLGQST